MKKFIIFSTLSLLLFCCSSCLKEGLEPANYSKANAITDVQFEYRWVVKNTGGVDVLKFQAITVDKTIDAAAHTVTLVLTVPPASATGDFSAAVRANVTRAGLASSFFVSTAASVKPINGAPALGVMANFSADSYQYQIIAGNGDISIWTIKITAFNKP